MARFAYVRTPYLRGPANARFWPKVNKQGRIHPTLGQCWEWTAAVNEFGYGLFRVNGRNVRAHRWAYERMAGPIPAGLVLDHLCRNPACVRPAHLEPVTQQENSRRGLPGGRVWRRERTHCKNGHQFTEENTRFNIDKRDGHVSRTCCDCAREQRQARRS